MSGFIVKPSDMGPVRADTFREGLHKGLDEIINRMLAAAEAGSPSVMMGGALQLEHPLGLTMRVTCCVFDDQKECVWCNGTGVEGS